MTFVLTAVASRNTLSIGGHPLGGENGKKRSDYSRPVSLAQPTFLYARLKNIFDTRLAIYARLDFYASGFRKNGNLNRIHFETDKQLTLYFRNTYLNTVES